MHETRRESEQDVLVQVIYIRVTDTFQVLRQTPFLNKVEFFFTPALRREEEITYPLS